MKCKYHIPSKCGNLDFKDCSETGLPCPHTGIMPYKEIENDELNTLCFFAEYILEQQNISEIKTIQTKDKFCSTYLYGAFTGFCVGFSIGLLLLQIYIHYVR